LQASDRQFFNLVFTNPCFVLTGEAGRPKPGLHGQRNGGGCARGHRQGKPGPNSSKYNLLKKLFCCYLYFFNVTVRMAQTIEIEIKQCEK
jgi:hypothetical protein